MDTQNEVRVNAKAREPPFVKHSSKSDGHGRKRNSNAGPRELPGIFTAPWMTVARKLLGGGGGGGGKEDERRRRESRLRGSGGMLPQKSFKLFRSPEMPFPEAISLLT